MNRKGEIQVLRGQKLRRLQKLKEQQATRGIDTAVHILIEIEDLEIEIDNLQIELAELPKISEETDAILDGINESVNRIQDTFTRLPQLKNGDRFLNRFMIKGFIGRGGFSDTYIAWDQQKDTEVAVKRLPTGEQEPNYLIRYVAREIKIARKLLSSYIPGLIRTYEVIETDGEICLIQENIPGRSLHNRIKEKGIVDVQEAINTIIKVGKTLEGLHQSRIVHCDVKPLNIIVRSPRNPTLIDLGVARFLDEPLDKQEIAVSIPYSPKELLTGKPIDGRVDVYSLGMTLMHMLTGLPMFEDIDIDDSMPFPQAIGRIPNDKTIRIHIVEALWEIEYKNLRAIIKTALADEPDNRFPDMASFCNELIVCAKENDFSLDSEIISSADQDSTRKSQGKSLFSRVKSFFNLSK